MALVLRGKPLAALRAIAVNPGGLRLRAFPSVMPMLQEMELVRVRERGRAGVVARRCRSQGHSAVRTRRDLDRPVPTCCRRY
jgi:hypothetical protein